MVKLVVNNVISGLGFSVSSYVNNVSSGVGNSVSFGFVSNNVSSGVNCVNSFVNVSFKRFFLITVTLLCWLV